MIRIVKEDGSIVEREATTDELKQMENDRLILEAENLKISAKMKARQSALNKLIDLGLTEEEIAAL